MRNFLIVLKYTFLENIKKKSFIITSIIFVSLIVILFNINNIYSKFNNNNSNTSNVTQKIALVSDNVIYNQYLSNLKIPETDYTFVSDNRPLNDIKKDVSSNKLAAAVVIKNGNDVPTFDYFVKDEMSMLNPDIISNIIKSTYMSSTLQAYNIDQQTITKLNTPITYSIEKASGGSTGVSTIAMSFIVSIILFFAIYFYGYFVSMSVSSEKTSRVMETLVTSTKPSTIVLGKTAAMGLLGLTQLLLVLLTAVISYKLFVGKNLILFGSTIDFSFITPSILILLIIYFVLGYALYAMLNAVTGSTVSRAEDLMSASMPISMITLLSFYLGYFSLLNPTSSINTFASIMPFSSAFTMISRMIISPVPLWQVLLSIAILIITILLLAVISIRIYSAGILHYGEKASLKALFKMSKDN